MKRIAILGSTGSIGRQALDVIGRHRDRFEVVGLAAGRNASLLREQAQQFDVPLTTLLDERNDGLMRVATQSGAELVLAATDGSVAFDAVFAAVRRGINIALANKELIVAAGELLLREAAESGSTILPVDSEHSALFQCLLGEPKPRVAKLILTASGGPFWEKTAAEMESATVEDALAHPTWRMGTKNTIDSATLMNKGLEVIEASRLFGIAPDRIAVLVHRTSVAHGLALFTDGSVKAQLCPPDMRVPIGYALAFPDRLDDTSLWPDARLVDPLHALGARDGEDAATLRFERPDPQRFPCLRLAYTALERGGTAPAVLSAANEIAVRAFVDGRIGFRQIPEIIHGALESDREEELSLDAVRRADAHARIVSKNLVERRYSPA